MTMQADFPITAAKATGVLTDAAEMWAQNLQKVAEQVGTPSFPSMIKMEDATASLERWFDFSERMAKVNREYALNLAGAMDAFGGAVRQHVQGLTEVLQDQTQA